MSARRNSYRAVWSPKYNWYEVQRRAWFSPFWRYVKYADDIEKAKEIADRDAAPLPQKPTIHFGRLP